MIEVTLAIQFTPRAAKALPPGQTSFRLQGLDSNSQKSLAVGDKVRLRSIDNCPWFVVAARFWELGEASTLTIWLDEPED
jgi:hypothetical protein